jgi:hypothetical protein
LLISGITSESQGQIESNVSENKKMDVILLLGVLVSVGHAENAIAV